MNPVKWWRGLEPGAQAMYVIMYYTLCIIVLVGS